MRLIVPAEYRGARPGDDENEAARLRMIERRNREALASHFRNGGR